MHRLTGNGSSIRRSCRAEDRKNGMAYANRLQASYHCVVMAEPPGKLGIWGKAVKTERDRMGR
jgi:hypothetical protein